ncbi:MAG: hypothetical protein JWM68_4294 [Verrucomicrobiales bacterium]|nr:hypothetical protein [Verrucomicrobiales bacterium]
MIVLLLTTLALVVGCSTPTKQKWLSRFFDGVPVPGGPTNQVTVQYDESGKPLDLKEAPKIDLTPKVAPVFYRHPPYEDKQCSECHKSKYSPELKAPQKDVCFACHDDFAAKLKFKHQPVENGECNACHDPHGSPLPKMLTKLDGALCSECHDSFAKKNKHQPVENGECLSCHKPHASEFAKLLLKPDGKLCFECHDEFQKNLEKAAFKHDPAANGDCRSCHDPHHSDEKGLLIKSPQKVCFECHEEKDIAAIKGHADVGLKTCVDCHDPHFGKDKFLLKIESLKPSTAPAVPK